MNHVREFLWHPDRVEDRRFVEGAASVAQVASIGLMLLVTAVSAVAILTLAASHPFLGAILSGVSLLSFVALRDVYVISGNCLGLIRSNMNSARASLSEGQFLNIVLRETWIAESILREPLRDLLAN